MLVNVLTGIVAIMSLLAISLLILGAVQMVRLVWSVLRMD